MQSTQLRCVKIPSNLVFPSRVKSPLFLQIWILAALLTLVIDNGDSFSCVDVAYGLWNSPVFSSFIDNFLGGEYSISCQTEGSFGVLKLLVKMRACFSCYLVKWCGCHLVPTSPLFIFICLISFFFFFLALVICMTWQCKFWFRYILCFFFSK